MADSDQDKQVSSAFDDDLEKMLQDNAEQVSTDEAILDDKDVIDQLLDDSQGQQAVDDVSIESVDDIVDSLLDDVASGQEQVTNALTEEGFDEFSEDPLGQLTDVSRNDIDQLLQSTENSAPESIDEFAEESDVETGQGAPDAVADVSLDLNMDEFSEEASIGMNVEQEVERVEPAMTAPTQVSAENMTEIDEFAESEDDFLMADFDISADEDEVPVEQHSLPESSAGMADELEATVVMSAEPVMQGGDSTAIQAIHERLETLENALADQAQNSNSSGDGERCDALEKTLNGQKKVLRGTAEAASKLKVFSLSGLVIGMLAFIMGIVILVMTINVPAELEELQNTIMDIEDGLAVSDPNTQAIQTLQDTVLALQANHVRLAATFAQLEQRMADNKQQNAQLLKTDMDQQLLVITEQLGVLEQKLLKTRVAKRRVASTRKVTRKPKVQEWVVNLVSFKQRWYTDNKVTEFKKKGIPAEVVTVDVRGVEWYRIRVVGFKDKIAAGSYAVKVKRSLNLSSVWVSAK